jgi:hypothetical protein
VVGGLEQADPGGSVLGGTAEHVFHEGAPDPLIPHVRDDGNRTHPDDRGALVPTTRPSSSATTE